MRLQGGTDAAGVRHAYDVLVQTGTGGSGYNDVPDMFAGTYTVTQTPVSRYVPGESQAIHHASPNGTNAAISLLSAPDGARAEARFPYSIRQMGGFGSMGSQTNRLKK